MVRDVRLLNWARKGARNMVCAVALHRWIAGKVSKTLWSFPTTDNSNDDKNPKISKKEPSFTHSESLGSFDCDLDA